MAVAAAEEVAVGEAVKAALVVLKADALAVVATRVALVVEARLAVGVAPVATGS